MNDVRLRSLVDIRGIHLRVRPTSTPARARWNLLDITGMHRAPRHVVAPRWRVSSRTCTGRCVSLCWLLRLPGWKRRRGRALRRGRRATHAAVRRDNLVLEPSVASHLRSCSTRHQVRAGAWRTRSRSLRDAVLGPRALLAPAPEHDAQSRQEDDRPDRRAYPYADSC